MNFYSEILSNTIIRNIAILLIIVIGSYVFYNLGKNIGEIAYYITNK